MAREAPDDTKLEAKAERATKPQKEAAQVPPTKKRKKQHEKSDDATASVLPREIAGYVVVPIQLNSFPGKRYLFYKENVNKGDESDAKSTPNGRALIITNISVDTTEEVLQTIFERFGKIASISFKRLLVAIDEKAAESEQAKQTGQRGMFAHLVFTSPKSLTNALNATWETVSIPATAHGLGIDKWLESYKGGRPDPTSIMAEVDAFMFEFDKKQQQARLELEKTFNKPDQDGFVLVQRKGRKRLREGGANVTAAKVTPELIEKAKKTKVLDDFYRFQRRENMRKQLADLRIRFEEDKKRIAKMRAQRKFKPG